jgi:hypothetical protein
VIVVSSDVGRNDPEVGDGDDGAATVWGEGIDSGERVSVSDAYSTVHKREDRLEIDTFLS